MNAQFYAVPGGPVESVFGQPLRVAHASGEFRVIEGRVWLTRRGDPDDHVLEAGERIVLEPGDDAVIEPWSRDAPARLAWRPLPRVSRVARWLRRAWVSLRDLARGAGSIEGRPQGCA